jgi:hypothetical protein
MARWNHKISLPSGTKLPQTPRFNQLWKRYEDRPAHQETNGFAESSGNIHKTHLFFFIDRTHG